MVSDPSWEQLFYQQYLATCAWEVCKLKMQIFNESTEKEMCVYFNCYG